MEVVKQVELQRLDALEATDKPRAKTSSGRRTEHTAEANILQAILKLVSES